VSASPASEPTALLHADDRTLVGRAADGDLRAYAVLIARYQPMMTAYARKLLGRTDEVDDAVQESLIAAWTRLADLEDPTMVRGWLMRIVSNKSIDRIRRRHDHDDLDHHPQRTVSGPGPETQAIARSRETALAQVLSALPPQQRQCWTLKEIGDYSYQQIATELGLPLSTVRGLLSRARRTVTQEMEQWR